MRLTIAALVTWIAIPASTLSAQAARDSLTRGGDAYDLAEYDAAVRALSFGLDPAAGPRDSLWVTSVHKLAHGLIQMGRGSLATPWIRWAIRQMPRLPVNDQDFPPSVIAAFDSARARVQASGGDDTVAVTTWEWGRPAVAQEGSLRLLATDVPIKVSIEGMGPVAAVQVPLRAGTYRITASAEGYRPATLSREVLPGVTTVLEFFLRSASVSSPGYIYVTSVPWGSVYIDGQPANYTPVAARRVEPGVHRLRIERVGYVPFDTVVRVLSTQRVRLGTVTLGKQGSGR